MRLLKTLFAIGLIWLATITAQAKVVRVEITSRINVSNGKEFGLAGTYENIVGKVYFVVDPNDPHNK